MRIRIDARKNSKNKIRIFIQTSHQVIVSAFIDRMPMIGQVGVRIPERFRETREIVPPGKPPRDHIKNVKGSLENLKQTGAIFWHIVIEPRRLVAHIAAKTVSSP